MKFSHIRVFEKAVKLDWTIDQPIGSATMTTSFASADPPLQSFRDALQAFAPYVSSLLDLPEHWQAELVVTGLSIDREAETGLRGLIITVRRRIEKANGRPVIINTPRMPEAGETTSDKIATLADAEIELLETAEREAYKYVKGEREQGQLFPNVVDPIAAAEAATSRENGDKEKRQAASKTVGRRKGKNFVPGVGDVFNPESTTPPATDDQLRDLLLLVDRDVPIDAIRQWTSSERAAAERWAGAAHLSASDHDDINVPPEPACVKASAMARLIDDAGWTAARVESGA
jgi:hypothetical protein